MQVRPPVAEELCDTRLTALPWLLKNAWAAPDNLGLADAWWTDSPDNLGSSAARGFGKELKELLPLLLWVLAGGAGHSDKYTRAGGA